MAKLWRIIKSRFEKETGEYWILERREICRTCPYNSNNSQKSTFKQKVYKILSNFYTLLTRSENEDLGECFCGCSVYFLTRDKESQCSAKEEYGDDKWKSIFIPQNSKRKAI